MNMGIAEEGLAQRVAMAARCAGLAMRGVGTRRKRQQQREREPCDAPHWYTEKSVTCAALAWYGE